MHACSQRARRLAEINQYYSDLIKTLDLLFYKSDLFSSMLMFSWQPTQFVCQYGARRPKLHSAVYYLTHCLLVSWLISLRLIQNLYELWPRSTPLSIARGQVFACIP